MRPSAPPTGGPAGTGVELFADRLGPCTHVGLHRIIARRNELGVALPEAGNTAAVMYEWQEGQRREVRGSPHFFAGDQSSFCPALEIERVGDRLRIRPDPTAFEAFVTPAFSGA